MESPIPRSQSVMQLRQYNSTFQIRAVNVFKKMGNIRIGFRKRGMSTGEPTDYGAATLPRSGGRERTGHAASRRRSHSVDGSSRKSYIAHAVAGRDSAQSSLDTGESTGSSVSPASPALANGVRSAHASEHPFVHAFSNSHFTVTLTRSPTDSPIPPFAPSAVRSAAPNAFSTQFPSSAAAQSSYHHAHIHQPKISGPSTAPVSSALDIRAQFHNVMVNGTPTNPEKDASDRSKTHLKSSPPFDPHTPLRPKISAPAGPRPMRSPGPLTRSPASSAMPASSPDAKEGVQRTSPSPANLSPPAPASAPPPKDYDGMPKASAPGSAQLSRSRPTQSSSLPSRSPEAAREAAASVSAPLRSSESSSQAVAPYVHVPTFAPLTASASMSSTTTVVPSSVPRTPLNEDRIPPPTLRLSTLPTRVNFMRMSTEGSARVSPSVIARTPPPRLTLPPLPPPTPSSAQNPMSPASAVSAPRTLRLNSMPALTRQGPVEVREDNYEAESTDEESGEESENDEGDAAQRSEDEDDDSGNSGSNSLEMERVASRSAGTQRRLMTIPASSPLSFHLPRNADISREREDGSTPRPAPATGTVTVKPSTLAHPLAATDYFSAKTPSTHTPSPTTASPAAGLMLRQRSLRPRHGPSRSLEYLASPSVEHFDDGPRSSRVPSVRIDLPASSADSPVSTHLVPAATSAVGTLPDDTLARAGILRRRRSSMPRIGLPPPYPEASLPARPTTAALRPPVEPRPEEGREPLPPYANAVYLRAVLPRKMEFVAPGVQARDRKWRRVLCELDGTAFRVYRCPAASGGIGGWWERKVGAGDVAQDEGVGGGSATTPKSPVGERPVGKIGEMNENAGPSVTVEIGPSSSSSSAGAASGSTSASTSSSQIQIAQQQDVGPRPGSSHGKRARRGLAAALLHPTSLVRPSSRAGHSSSSSFDLSARRVSEDRAGPSNGRLSTSRGQSSLSPPSSAMSSPNLSTSTSFTSQSSLPASSSARTHFAPPPATPSATPAHSHVLMPPEALADIPEPFKSDLIKQYTMQRAESGLGNDYLKRKNVIRVRMEGEQFLLQAKDVPAVVQWIEGFHSATNIALELDERQMPKGPMFPRRRRRRPRRVEGQSISSAATTRSAQSPERGQGEGHS